MSFKLIPIDGDKWEITFSDEPDYIHALKMAPKSIELELSYGTWLISAFPVWSAPVRHSILSAITCAKQFGGSFYLGIRPFESYHEMNTWWPSNNLRASDDALFMETNCFHSREVFITAGTNFNPGWMVIHNGRVLLQSAGPRTSDELAEMMRKQMSRVGPTTTPGGS